MPGVGAWSRRVNRCSRYFFLLREGRNQNPNPCDGDEDMMRRTLVAPLMALIAITSLATALPSASAAINDEHPYQDVVPFSRGLDDVQTFLSGQVTGTFQAADATLGFIESRDLAVVGLTRACWQEPGLGNRCEEGDEVRVEVADSGSIGIATEGSSSLRVEADHALSLLVDLGSRQDLGGLDVGPSLVSSNINGRVSQVRLPPADGMPIASLSESTTIHIIVDDRVVSTLEGKRAVIVDGDPLIGAFRSAVTVLPLGTGSQVLLEPADPQLVADGLDPLRMTRLMESLNSASAGEPSDNGDVQLPDELRELMAEVFDGALLRVDLEGEGGNDLLSDLTLVRFSTLQIRPDGTGKVLVRGPSPLQVEGGEVAGASATLGVGLIQFPWWSWVLLALGVALWVVALTTRAPKQNEQWDRFRFVGWISAPLALILVFILWDREVEAVWGTSLMTSGGNGDLVLAGGLVILQLGSLIYLILAVVWPLQMVLRNGLRLARQGTFMGLYRPIGMVLGFLIGAPLLLVFLELVLGRLVEQLAGA